MLSNPRVERDSFHRAISTIFGKTGRLASEEVILELLKNKCMPC